MAWVAVNAWEKVEEPMASEINVDRTSEAVAASQEMFRSNIAEIVDHEFGGAADFALKTTIPLPTVKHWLKKGASRIKTGFEDALKGIGIQNPDELFEKPLPQIKRKPRSPSLVVHPAAPKSDTQLRFELLLNSPYKKPLQMAIDLMYNDLADMDDSDS